MKNIVFKFILPLAIVLFAGITKWWYTLPDDAPDTLYIGFPFPYIGDAWHTSMALQIFVLELLIDFLIYFLFCYGIVYLVHRFVKQVRIHISVVIAVWIAAFIVIYCTVFVWTYPEHEFYAKRPYEMKVLETGYKFGWQQTIRPDYNKYYPNGSR